MEAAKSAAARSFDASLRRSPEVEENGGLLYLQTRITSSCFASPLCRHGCGPTTEAITLVLPVEHGGSAGRGLNVCKIALTSENEIIVGSDTYTDASL